MEEEEALLGGEILSRRPAQRRIPWLFWGWRAVGGVPWRKQARGAAGDGEVAAKGFVGRGWRSVATVFREEAGAAVEWLVATVAWLGLRVRFCKIWGRTGGAQADDQRNPCEYFHLARPLSHANALGPVVFLETAQLL